MQQYVKIKHRNSYIEIEKENFDSSKHKLYEEPKKPQKKVRSVKDANAKS